MSCKGLTDEKWGLCVFVQEPTLKLFVDTVNILTRSFVQIDVRKEFVGFFVCGPRMDSDASEERYRGE